MTSGRIVAASTVDLTGLPNFTTLEKDAIQRATRDVRTFAELHHAANMLFDTALAHLRGNRYTIMGSILLRAFTFEAYLNHLGEKHLNLWGEKDQIQWWKKFRRVRKKTGFEPSDRLKRPYSTLRPLFAFRNAIAHGRSQMIEEHREVNARDDVNLIWPETEWEKYCTFENAIQARDDISELIIQLHKKAGFDDDPFAPPSASGSVRLKSTKL